MSQILNSAFLPRSEMEFGRMFNPYLHKGSENFDLALSVPDSSHHSYMTDQGNYGSYESGVGRAGNGETYTDMSALTATSLGAHDPPHTTPLAVPQQHTHPQAMYQMGVVGGGLHGGNNPQFPPQNLYIPPISQHGSLMAAQTTGYVGQGLAHNTPVYTSAALGLPTHNPPHPMMVTAGGMMPGTYYQRPPGPRSGGSPNSGGSPSPGSDDSDDSTQIGQGGRGKRPSPEAPTEPPPAKGKKARVSKKSKKKKDPNEPQKPVSAYALFFRDTQAAIKGQNPNASFGEVSKIVASMWDALDADSKSVYKKKTEAAKKEYLKALAAYRASLVSKGGEGDQMFQGPGQAYPQFGSNPSYGFPPSTNAGPLPPPHAQGHSSPQLSPLAKKSPLLSSLMTAEGGQQSLMNPPMSQPMPPSAPSMMTHGPIPTMNPTSMGPQGQTGNSQQVPHQPGTPTPSHLNAMSSVPPTSPYITQSNPSLGSPVSNMNSDVGSPGPHTIHKPTQQPSQQQQPQQQQQTQQQQSVQQANSHPQQTSPQHQGHHSLQQHGSNQGGGHPTSGPNGLPPCNMGSCIRAGCTNPAVHNPEWEDEYCSNECVVSHCRDVFNSWVASGQGNAPTYPAPVK